MIDNHKAIGKAKRRPWLDALRGFCMFLVVYMHISNFSIGLGASESAVMQVVFTCFLSTFYFISGYVSHKDSEIWTARHALLKLKDKFQQLIIPAVVFYVLYQMCKGEGLFAWMEKGFQGYWFLIVLFEVFVVYYMVSMISQQLSGGKFFVGTLMVVTVVLVFIPSVLSLSTRMRNILSIVNFTTYMPFFAIGVASKIYQNFFEKILRSEWLFALGLVAFVVIEWFICSAHSTDMYVVYGKVGYVMQMSVKYIATYLLVSLFFRNSEVWESETMLAKSLCFWVNERWTCIFCIGSLFHLFSCCMFMWKEGIIRYWKSYLRA